MIRRCGLAVCAATGVAPLASAMMHARFARPVLAAGDARERALLLALELS